MKATTEANALARPLLTKEELIRHFRSCGVAEGQTLIVHASLSKLGYVIGGAETLIRALLEIVGEEGTLTMPSQTWKNLDPSAGVHWELPPEAWPVVREHWPAYDKEVTPAIGMGVTAEMLRKWPGARRSDHPARSFAAVGKHSEFITAHHDLCNIFGEGSPLDKLYRLDARILLIGVGYEKNTSLHLAETRAGFPGKRFSTESSAIAVNGERRWVAYETQEVLDDDFARLGAEYDEERSIKVCRIGSADVRLLEQRSLVDWAVAWMERNRA
ncbi:aminoglycoside N(3)-acetyltransferase [Cohnella fermenti]|uniref:Aminoglycoside N(3)-acetyltransferase n=1 Tax=Cohnella fermenti TaxID=2565925 RepID=A0A4S4C8G9_9BACL|nr:AAC(3) family N-acetyltransferase [Cohnella fermenti]THF84257.1 AAC(3) family N-acetyltransferase [Cohnella fermenti]